jgi:hypothetical protein
MTTSFRITNENGSPGELVQIIRRIKLFGVSGFALHRAETGFAISHIETGARVGASSITEAGAYENARIAVQEWSTKASAPKEEAVRMAVVWTSDLIERLQR